jgi:phosphoribosyl 1,2-cyclic phosphodiesterase/ActR/RegA family two-component response regulator
MPAANSNSKGFVLIAEDVKVISRKMVIGLEQSGYKVALAEDGEQCLEMARSLRPNLVVLDIMMPKVHGIEVLKQIRADPELQDTGVIICTAKSFETELSHVATLGAYGFLIKPFTLPALNEMVNGFFASRPGTGFMAERRAPSHRTEEGEIFRPTLQTQSRYFTLWGTRGSMPTPGANYLRHGGQTSCMAVTAGDTVCIFDAGSGIRDLGLELMKSKFRTVHLFITHTHWDHIQGFPFFTPAYNPDFKINVYAVRGFGKDLKSLFSGQLDKDYFPIQMENMRGALNFIHLGHEPVELPGATVTWEFANHPGATVGYKIDLGDKKIAWVPDNEFLEGYTGSPDLISPEHERVAPYQKMVEFLSGVDLLVHEAQYTNEEYPGKTGWGHSCLSNACLLAKFARVRRWIVTHHDPSHDDTFLESKLNLNRQLLDRVGHPISVVHGYDGMTEYL